MLIACAHNTDINRQYLHGRQIARKEAEEKHVISVFNECLIQQEAKVDKQRSVDVVI